jgi:Tfp pilus assembly protein PilX|tara:strand:+ start:1339 stop:1980 length:642 start_codon:yes stop_codon:yes gene_type:complete
MINFRKKKGFVLALTLFVILAISSFSVAMMGIIQKNSQNSIRSHQINTVNQAAEFGLESGRLWLTDQMSRSGTTAITVTNSNNVSITGDCLALHGYTNSANNIHYAFRKINQSFAEIGSESDFGRYTYEFYVQRIGNHTTLNGYNYIPQETEGPDTLSPTVYNSRRIFYRVISCGYGPNLNKIVPLQLYLSAGGDGATGNVARAINIEGYYRP